jgi:hypothetical protein
MFNIYKIENSGRGFKQRLIIKTFKTSEAMHKFLNTKDNALFWNTCEGKIYKTMKSGLYAFAGGIWHNVKTLETSILAHI